VQFFGEVAEQARCSREQRHTAQQCGRQAQVGECSACHSRAVERQSTTKHLSVNPTDGLEQAQVRSSQSLLLCQLDDHGSAGIGPLMDRVAQPWNEAARRSLLRHSAPRQRVPLLIG